MRFFFFASKKENVNFNFFLFNLSISFSSKIRNQTSFLYNLSIILLFIILHYTPLFASPYYSRLKQTAPEPFEQNEFIEKPRRS